MERVKRAALVFRGLSKTRTSGNISILWWKLFLSPGDDDMFASGHVARQLDGEPSLQVLLAITKTTILTRVLLGTRTGPANQDVHHAHYIINGLKGDIHASMRIVSFLEPSQGTLCISSRLFAHWLPDGFMLVVPFVSEEAFSRGCFMPLSS